VIVFITDDAEEDLERIGDYIGQHNPVRAESFVDELIERAQSLSRMALRFSVVKRLEHRSVRRLPHKGYSIYYRVANERVEVLRILNGAQDYETILLGDDPA